jgi:hypothetical protein
MEKEDRDKLLRDLEVAGTNVKKSVSGKTGEGSEKAYGQAYYQCVKAGIKNPLKRKYR